MSNWRIACMLDNTHCGDTAKDIPKKMEESSLDSMEEINASQELYKKKELIKDDPLLEVPFKPLIGESPLFLGSTTEGPICLTDYRLCISANPLFTIPLGLIEAVEARENHHLYIQCKNAQISRCTFSENTICLLWSQRIQNAMVPNPELQECFSFLFYSWCRDEKSLFHQKNLKCGSDVPNTKAEAERMGFGKKWKICTINAKYSLCPSYPRYFILPRAIPDEWLESIANFRHSQRLPVVVWRHRKNGCVIARSSQPKVGFFGSLCKEDEALIMAILEASDQGSVPEQSPFGNDLLSLRSDAGCEADALHSPCEASSKMLVIDARSYTAAFANRAKGGGTEVSYPNCEVSYQNLANIHSVRRSFQNLRLLCANPPDPSLWLSSLESTKWLSYIGSLLTAAVQVVQAIDVDNRNVLVHCSDGWDRTPQIIALAELMMDPYYRTKKGFQVLVEREWLEFGHKFADRCGNAAETSDANERSPIFLQWLDCVYQLLDQCGSRFEFNEQYLVKLVYHTYSCLFGTFLCNTDQERRSHSVYSRTYSVWSHLNRDLNFHNHLYEETTEILKVSYMPNALKFWNSLYVLSPFFSSGTLESPDSLEPRPGGSGSTLARTKSSKSCDDISFLGHSSGHQRRSSDTSIKEIPCTNENGEFSSSDSFSKDAKNVVDNSIFLKDAFGERTKGGEICNPDCLNFNKSTDTLVYKKNELQAALHSDIFEQLKPDALPEIKSSNMIINYILEKDDNSSGSSSTAVTPHHSRSSSGIPSSPCDEYGNSLLTKGLSVPQHILDIDGSLINKDEIQIQAWKKISIRDEKIRSLEKKLQQHAAIKAWILKHHKKFEMWLADMFQENISDNDASSIDDPSNDDQEIQSTGSEDFVKIEARDVAPLEQSTSYQSFNCRDFKVVCSGCYNFQASRDEVDVMPVCEVCYSKIYRQCRQSVQSCDKMPKAVITATSN